MIDFRVVNKAAEVEGLMEQGYVPIECSVDGKSIVDAFGMDHHGTMSYNPPVSLMAMSPTHYGAGRNRVGFVTVGSPDADACWAVAAMLALVPNDESAMQLAETIGVLDIDPIGRDILNMPGGRLVALWNTLMGGVGADDLGFSMGVRLWQTLTNKVSVSRLAPYLKGAEDAEVERRKLAQEDMEQGWRTQGILTIPQANVFGFDVWYSRCGEDGDPRDAASWKNPVVIARNAIHGHITIGCPNKHVAEELFGNGGLANLWKKLDAGVAEGWGGHASVGGSPRGMKFDVDVLDVIESIIVENMFLE
jgi:hypothetical protein